MRKKWTICLLAMLCVVGTLVMPREAMGASTSSIAKKVISYVADARYYLGKAARSAKYFTKALQAFDTARTIGKGLQEEIFRNKLAEQAYDQGYKDGRRDGARFRSDPRRGWIDVCNRCYYANRGSTIAGCYDAGYAEGFKRAAR